MNRLVLIHGRSQGGKNSEIIETSWTCGLRAGFESIGEPPPPADRVEAPFYGDELDKLTESAEFSVFEVIFRGAEEDTPADGDSPDLDEWDVEFLTELARGSGITDEEIRRHLRQDAVAVTDRAPWNWEWVQAIGRALESNVPLVSNAVMWQVTRDVRAYLSRRRIRRAVHEIVRPRLEGERCVVVAHSLGSIVAYWLLTEMGRAADVSLLVTAGSPLGAESIKRRLPPALGMPQGVDAWLNVTDPRDPVAVYDELGGDTFPAPIDNIPDISNPKDNPHSIVGYLSDPRVAKRVALALET